MAPDLMPEPRLEARTGGAGRRAETHLRESETAAVPESVVVVIADGLSACCSSYSSPPSTAPAHSPESGATEFTAETPGRHGQPPGWRALGARPWGCSTGSAGGIARDGVVGQRERLPVVCQAHGWTAGESALRCATGEPQAAPTHRLALDPTM